MTPNLTQRSKNTILFILKPHATQLKIYTDQMMNSNYWEEFGTLQLSRHESGTYKQHKGLVSESIRIMF